MVQEKAKRQIVIVDDEHRTSGLIVALRARLEKEGWEPVVLAPKETPLHEAYESATLDAIGSDPDHEPAPVDAVILDMWLGTELFGGLSILKAIRQINAFMPVLVLSKHQEINREFVVEQVFKLARVDHVDKLASVTEVLLKLRNLVGYSPADRLTIADLLMVDCAKRRILRREKGEWTELKGFEGHRFDVFRELASAHLRNQEELVSAERLMQNYYPDGGMASLRSQISKMRDDLADVSPVTISQHERLGYRLVPLHK